MITFTLQFIQLLFSVLYKTQTTYTQTFLELKHCNATLKLIIYKNNTQPPAVIWTTACQMVPI